MRIFTCEKCGKGFVPNDEEEIFQIRSGRRLSEPVNEEILTCPYCGHVQENGQFLFPL